MVDPPVANRNEVPRTLITPDAATDVQELFVEGQALLRLGEPARAAAVFDRIVLHDPEGLFSERALFQGALAHEQAGDLPAAAARFEQLSRRFPDTERGNEALIRAVRVRLHLEQWEGAGALGAEFLEHSPNGPPLGLIIANAARALGMLALGKSTDADYFLAKGFEVIERLQLDRAGSIPRDLAVLYFAQGEARRQKAEQATLSGDVEQFSASLEQRCQLLLSAQSSYSDTMRAYDAHWSTMAGYRVGELYEKLHTELMSIPMPKAGSLHDQQLFEGTMRLRYSVLLEKAATMLDHTLTMASRTGETSEWVHRTARARATLAQAMLDEKAALDRLPFTRADLQKAMDDLEARANGRAGKPVRGGGR